MELLGSLPVVPVSRIYLAADVISCLLERINKTPARRSRLRNFSLALDKTKEGKGERTRIFSFAELVVGEDLCDVRGVVDAAPDG